MDHQINQRLKTGYYLTFGSLRQLNSSLNELDALDTFIDEITDADQQERIRHQIALQRHDLLGQYSEVEQEDGSVLIKHPAIGVISIEDTLCDKSTRLFYAMVNSLSIKRIRVYKADALVSPNETITYINRRLHLEVKMTQSAYIKMMANSGRETQPATLTQIGDQAIEYEGDMSSMASQMLYENSMSVIDRVSTWQQALEDKTDAALTKRGPLSKASREAMLRDVRILGSWTEQNPVFQASLLAEHAEKRSAEAKMELSLSSHFKGEKA